MKPYVTGLSFFLCLTLISLSHCRYLTDEDDDLPRYKRQTADMRATELLAIKKMLDKLDRQGCTSYACGLIDVFNRYYKRSWSDQTIAELKARLGLDNSYDIAHGRIDPYRIFIKRTSSDQRMAELQALIALAHGRGNVAHGRIDPSLIGRRKRDLTFTHRSLLKNYFKQRPNLHQEDLH